MIPASSSLREILNRLRSFFHKQPLDRDLDAEVSAHLEFAIEENRKQGMSEQEARRQALVRFGGVTQAKEQQREARGLPWFDVLIQDLRYTLRTLRRDPAFAIIAVLILALGIGANIAVFSVINPILLRPLPFQDPQQLVWLGPTDSKCGFSCATYTADAYDQFRAQNTSFQDVTGYYAFSGSDNYKLTGRGEPSPATGIMVIGNFFNMMGVQPSIGRVFTEDEARRNSRPVVLLANAYWRQHFAADAKIVGTSIDLNGQPTEVVGVLPTSFDFGAVFAPGTKVDLYTPEILDSMRDDGNIVTLIGRLKPGVSLAQAQAEAKVIAPKLYFTLKDPNSKNSYKLAPIALKEYVSGKLRRSLIVLWSAVGMILLIVCVNLSNLLLARAATRSKEFALRSALGCGRMRLIRQLLTESFVLSGAGAALGLLLACAITSFLAHQSFIALPLLSSVRIDLPALVWTLIVTILSAIVFGIVPAMRVSSSTLYESLKNTGPGMSAGKQHERLRAALVISEVALACMLLVGAGLLLRSFLHVLDVDLGFEPSMAAAINVDFDDGNDANSAQKRSVIFQQILRRIEALPGVEAAGMVDNLPLGQNRSWGPPQVKGKQYRPGELPGTLVYVVTPGYLRAMGMKVRGRDFTWDDSPTGQKVIILDETAASTLFPGEDAIGKTVDQGGRDELVVGVIADVHQDNVEAAPGWQMYFPATQEGPMGAKLVIRSRIPPATLANSVLSTLRQMNPNQPASEFQPIQKIVDHAISPRWFFMLLVGAFAVLGLVLASLGIYGVIAYSVTRRTQEIGIRMALGATRSRVQMDVIRKTLELALIGIGVGAVASFAVSKAIAALLYGTEPGDPATFAIVVLLLSVVAVVAGLIPARRASHIDPMVALRDN